MPVVDDRYVVAGTLSEAWLDAVRYLYGLSAGKAVHLLVRITQPTAEVAEIRSAADELINECNKGKPSGQHYYDIETTRNTLFPAAWAARHPEPEDLAVHYRGHYTSKGLLGVRANSRGTYFGRIVAYPRADNEEPADQLSETVRKLRVELAGGRPKSSRYEINIYHERSDTNPMSFPCLAHLSVHLHEQRLHLQAIYRNEYLVGRAYGNYLGLAQLQAYIAEAVGTEIGELLVTAGHAELDGSRRAVRSMLEELGDAKRQI
jgi:thymidylate synthase